MGKSYYIVTMDTYIGHNPFDAKKAVGGIDIQTICTSFEDAHLYIDRTIAYNIDANDQEIGKDVIVCRVEKPDFFKGHEVDVYFTDTRDNKKWMWVYSVYERSLYNPNKKQTINKELRDSLKEAEEEMRKGHFITHEEFKKEVESWLKEKKKTKKIKQYG